MLLPIKESTFNEKYISSKGGLNKLKNNIKGLISYYTPSNLSKFLILKFTKK